MKATKYTIQACCGRTSIIYKTDRPIVKSDLDKLVSMGFTQTDHFLKAGILYATNKEYLLTAPLGSDRLTVKCQVADCSQKLNDFEVLLQQLG